jgi:hypothetical protein
MPYTDWINIVESAIPNKEELSILEFGLGEGTKYLLEKFKYVYSYELINHDEPGLKFWYDESYALFNSNPKWGSELVMWNEIGFEDYNPDIPQGLTDRIDELFVKYNFDTILIDGGYHVRGDIANYILNKWNPSYVIIHDTNYAYEVDGYTRIKLPSTYETIEYKEGEGTHIFVNKNK